MINAKLSQQTKYLAPTVNQGRKNRRQPVSRVHLNERIVRDEALRGSILAEGITISEDLLVPYPTSCAEEQVQAEKTQV